MPMFVHLTAEKDVRRITAHAIRGRRRLVVVDGMRQEIPQAVYCMPVMPDFHLTHQWLRELKRNGQRTVVGIYFRLSSDELIWVGRYNLPHQRMRAGDAIKLLDALPDIEGYEVIVPRNITAKEIDKVRYLPQTVGWRYMPQSHTDKPTCGCPYCIPKGSIKSRKLRARLEAT